MTVSTQSIHEIENQIKNALLELEMGEKLEEAQASYRQCRQELNQLEIETDEPTYQ